LNAAREPGYGGQIVAVGADRPGCAGLDRAAEEGVPTFVCRLKDHPDRETWDGQLATQVAQYEPDLVISAGFLKLVGPQFLSRFGGRYLNTHNSLLPAFPGMHGPREALEYGVKIAGATLFVVDEGVDTGAIIAQCAVPVLDDDAEETLTERIKEGERARLVDYTGRLAREGGRVEGARVHPGPPNRVPTGTANTGDCRPWAVTGAPGGAPPGSGLRSSPPAPSAWVPRQAHRTAPPSSFPPPLQHCMSDRIPVSRALIS